MKISPTLLKTIAAGLLLGGVITSCGSEKALTTQDQVYKADHKQKKLRKKDKFHIDNCLACGRG